mmetsp:Transcript_89012/g.108903  ORF Transcript_89012/g.108903 Transcript_89012/m.108903 type:complete len:188 (-) Transcript_89012:179-742(-)
MCIFDFCSKFTLASVIGGAFYVAAWVLNEEICAYDEYGDGNNAWDVHSLLVVFSIITVSQFVIGMFVNCVASRCQGKGGCCTNIIGFFAIISVIYVGLNIYNLIEFSMMLFGGKEKTHFAEYKNYDECGMGYIFYASLVINLIYSLVLLIICTRGACCPPVPKGKASFKPVDEPDDNEALITGTVQA